MSDEQGNMQNPGQVDVMKITIKSSSSITPVDLTEVWTEISIYEDISLNHIMGEITVLDSLNLIEELPITGNERIELEFRTKSYQGSSYKMTGYVHGIESQTTIRPGVQAYVIRFLSPEYVADLQMKVSKAFQYQQISEIAYNIYSSWPTPKESLYYVGKKNFNISPSINAMSLVVPNISPMTSLNWLATKAIAANYSGGAHYLFFENQHGYHFKTVEELIDKKNHPEETIVHYKFSASGSLSERPTQDKFESIVEYSRSEQCSTTLKDISEGMYSSKLLTYDLVTGKIGETPYNYFTSYNKMSHAEGSEEKTKMSNNPSFGGQYDSFTVIAGKHYGMFGTTDTASDVEKSILQRRSQVAQLDKQKLDIKIYGNSTRSVGQVIKVSVPSIGVSTLKDKEGQQDKWMSGRYLITQLCHHIAKDDKGMNANYFTDMSVSSDSYASQLPEKVGFSWGGSSDFGQSVEGVA